MVSVSGCGRSPSHVRCRVTWATRRSKWIQQLLPVGPRYPARSVRGVAACSACPVGTQASGIPWCVVYRTLNWRRSSRSSGSVFCSRADPTLPQLQRLDAPRASAGCHYRRWVCAPGHPAQLRLGTAAATGTAAPRGRASATTTSRARAARTRLWRTTPAGSSRLRSPWAPSWHSSCSWASTRSTRGGGGAGHSRRRACGTAPRR